MIKAFTQTVLPICGLNLSIVFTQKDLLGSRNKWPLLVMCNGEKIFCSSLFAPQLGSAADTFLSIIKSSVPHLISLSLQVYNIP